VTDELGNPFCQCVGSFTGDDCETKSEFAYIAGGIAGAIIFLILLVLLVWMICVRATRPKKQEKVGLGPGAEMGHQGAGNFYYGAPAPYAESIAPATTAPTPTTMMTRRMAGTCPTSTMRDT